MKHSRARARSHPNQMWLFQRLFVPAPPARTAPPSSAPSSPPSSALKPRRAPRQAPGPAPDPAADLRARLAERLRGKLDALVLTDNRQRIVSARPTEDGGYAVRLHRGFASASEETLDAVAAFILSRRADERRRRALAEIRRHFEVVTAGLPPPARKRRRTLEPVGRSVDLREIRDEVNRRFFAGALDVRISWGRAPAARKRRRRSISIRLGSYHREERLVLIHRALDRGDVPREVVEMVVYHEMLHAAIPPREGRGRRILHSAEFRRRERLHPRFEATERWIEEHLGHLAGID